MRVVKLESTKAKAGFAKLPERARNGDVALTRHGRIQAYVLSPDRYASLVGIAEVGKDELQKLDEEFEALVARMQTPRQQKAIQAIATLPLSEILAQGALKARTRKTAKRRQGARSVAS